MAQKRPRHAARRSGSDPRAICRPALGAANMALWLLGHGLVACQQSDCCQKIFSAKSLNKTTMVEEQDGGVTNSVRCTQQLTANQAPA